MFKRTTIAVGILFLTALQLKACDERHFVTLPHEETSVRIGSILNFDMGHYTVTVKNSHGRASDKIFAVNDNTRSNIYLTPSGQLVIIDKGGKSAFFQISNDAAPTTLNGPRTKLRDERSDLWHYIGVIENRVLTHKPECIPLMGEGRSPYRKQFQKESSC